MEAKFQHSDPYYRDLIKAIYGIFFFGTPHKGMVVENLLEAMEATGVSQERIELVKSIESNCETLKEEVRRFINLCSNIKICTFTETEQTAKVVVVSLRTPPVQVVWYAANNISRKMGIGIET